MTGNDNARRRGNGGRAEETLQTWPGCSSENNPSPDAPQAPRQYPKRWMLAAVRRRQIIRLVEHRRAAGVAPPVRGTMIVAADCLADLEGWPVPPFGNPHLGLHPIPVRQMADDLQFAIPDDLVDEAIEVIADMRKHGGNLSSDEAGRLVGLNRSEREACRVWLLDAAEEPREARKARKAAEKRDRDRERNRAKRDQRRAAAGLSPIDRSTSPPPRKEWEMLNLSRPTYFRLKKAGRLPTVADDRETPASPTYGKDRETPASRTLDRPIGDARVSRLASMQENRPESKVEIASAQDREPSAVGGRSSDRHHDTVAQAESSLLSFLGQGSIRRGRTVSETLGPGTVKAWFYLHSQGLMTPEQIAKAETALSRARAAADQPEAERGAA